MSNNTESRFPNAGLDVSIGVVLAFASVAGTIMNLVAFSYFKNKTKRNLNGEYFRRLFSIITVNDVIVCCAVFPVIDATFCKERNAQLFGNAAFCWIWFVVWHTAWQMSLITVAMLSLSRFLVIRYPHLVLSPWITYGALGSLAASILIYWLTVVGLNMVYPTYYKEYLFCGASLFRDLASMRDSHKPFPRDNYRVRKIIISLATISIVLSFLIVSISFIMSLVYLQCRKNVYSNNRASNRRQYAAAKTVIIFSFINIISNTPVMMVAFYMLQEITNPLKHGSTGAEIMAKFSFNNNSALEQYAWPISMIFTTCLNSTINPILYYLRMQGFARFVSDLFMRWLQCVVKLRDWLLGVVKTTPV